MNIVSLAPVHPCRQVIIAATNELAGTLLWADSERHFFDLLASNSHAFGIMASKHRTVPESVFIRQSVRFSLTNPLYVFLLGKGSDYRSIVRSLAAGADQAEIWPVDPRLLVAQIKAAVARDRGNGAEIVRFGGVQFDTTTGDVVGSRGKVYLTRVEGRLLAALARYPNRVLSKAFLHRVLYNEDTTTDLKIIDVFVHKVRKKLSAICSAEHIETAWGQGYSFHVDGFEPVMTEMRIFSHRREAAE